LSEEVEQVKAKMVVEEVENYKHDNVLQKKMNVKGEHTSQLEQYKLEMKDMSGCFAELENSCGKNEEDRKTLQEEVQAEQYVEASVNPRD
jgi:glycine cleavage system pyridoxal-binding protein P